jgi:hypothetical protein
MVPEIGDRIKCGTPAACWIRRTVGELDRITRNSDDHTTSGHTGRDTTMSRERTPGQLKLELHTKGTLTITRQAGIQAETLR